MLQYRNNMWMTENVTQKTYEFIKEFLSTETFFTNLDDKKALIKDEDSNGRNAMYYAPGNCIELFLNVFQDDKNEMINFIMKKTGNIVETDPTYLFQAVMRNDSVGVNHLLAKFDNDKQ